MTTTSGSVSVVENAGLRLLLLSSKLQLETPLAYQKVNNNAMLQEKYKQIQVTRKVFQLTHLYQNLKLRAYAIDEFR